MRFKLRSEKTFLYHILGGWGSLKIILLNILGNLSKEYEPNTLSSTKLTTKLYCFGYPDKHIIEVCCRTLDFRARNSFCVGYLGRPSLKTIHFCIFTKENSRVSSFIVSSSPSSYRSNQMNERPRRIHSLTRERSLRSGLFPACPCVASI